MAHAGEGCRAGAMQSCAMERVWGRSALLVLVQARRILVSAQGSPGALVMRSCDFAWLALRSMIGVVAVASWRESMMAVPLPLVSHLWLRVYV